MRPVFIYALNDPRTGECRYLGQTVNPDRRLSKHLHKARNGKYHCAQWVNSLLSKKLRPVMEILDVVPDNEADFWECEYIQNFRERGFDLTNGTDGGEGGRYWPVTAETRAKISASQRGRKHSAETRSKIKAARAMQIFSLESRAKMRASQLGKKQTPEQIAKNAAARLGKKRGPYRKKNVLPN